MNIIKTDFKNLLILEPNVIRDDRGYFLESFNEAKFRIETGQNISFVQDNESVSSKNVLLGFHFQLPPYSQSKLIRVAQGSVVDVVVDLRRSQQTFLQHFKILLSAENQQQLFVPEGFAHGFLVLEDNTIFSYKCSNYYNKASDKSILWNEEAFGIDWGVNQPSLSDKDKFAMKFVDFENPFL